MAESRLVASLVVLAMVWLLVTASPAKCEFINPPVLHDTLQIRYYDPAYGWSSYAARGSALWKNVVYISGWPSNNSDDPIYSMGVSHPDNLVYMTRSGGTHVYYFNQMFAYEDKLFVAGWGDMLRIYDISIPGYPAYLGHYDRPCEPDPNDPSMPFCYFGWGVQVVGNRAYISEGSEKTSGIYIINVSNPANPTEVSRMELAEHAGGLAVRGSYLFYGYNHHGSSPEHNHFSFRVANISDETNPQNMSILNLTGIGAVGDIVLRGDIAYVSCAGLLAIDISNPANPNVISRWGTVGGQLLLLGDYAFIATGGNGCPFVNIADPANMYGVYTVYHPSPREYEDAVVGNGRYVYISTTSNKLVEDPPYNVLHAFEVFDQDPDDAGPGNWSNFSLGEASWDLQYEGDVLPTTANPAWTLVEGSNAWASASGGVLRINDTGTAPGDKVKWARSWDATNSRGTTVLSRAKCASYSLGSGPIESLINLSVRDGKYIEDFSILSDRIRAARANLEYSLDGTAWHTYRITTRGSQFQVFVDEASPAVLTGPLFVTRDQNPDAGWARVLIGSGSSPGTQDISFDYVCCFSNGAVGPAASVNTFTPTISVDVADAAGKGSLSGIDPVTARVQWSTDGGLTWNSSGGPQWQCRYEGSLLPSASVPNWIVADGSESWASVSSGVLRINDTSTAAGSKIKWSRDWNASPSVGTTVVARARCASVGNNTTFLGNIFVEDGVAGERFKIMTDRLAAAESGLTCLLNGTQWHVYRITTKNGQFRVYLDENPVAVLVGTLVPGTSNNRVMFGSGATEGTQDIYFDYVRYTAQGDLPPGEGDGGGSVTVTCIPAIPVTPPDRGTVTAYQVPFSRNSDVLNKVRFSLTDLAGNIGLSPIYNVRIANAPPPAVTDLTAFSADQRVTLSWKNPSSVEFTGTMIRFSTTGFPAGPAEGTLLADQANAPGSNDHYVHAGLTRGQVYYYTAFAHNGVPNYASGVQVRAKGSFLPDLDLDGDVDQVDFGQFQACFSGSGFAYHPECRDADLDLDRDVDQDDFDVLRGCLAGADSPPGC